MNIDPPSRRFLPTRVNNADNYDDNDDNDDNDNKIGSLSGLLLQKSK